MNGTSSGSDLQARLQKRAEQDREQIEEVVQSQLNELSKNLKNIVKRELYTIERRDALTRLVEREQTRLDQLLVQTWGVWLHEAEAGARSVALPRGTPLDNGWPYKVQGQSAVPLSSE